MRVTISPAIEADHEEIRTIIRRGFRGTSGADVEVHVKGSWGWKFIPSDDGKVHHYKDGTSAAGRYLKIQGSFHGRAYEGVPGIANTGDKTRYLVTLNMPVRPDELDHYPKEHKDRRAKSMPTYTIASWRDHLLKLAAHEAYHIIQFRRGLPASEVECERHSVHVLTGERCSHPRKRSKRGLKQQRVAAGRAAKKKEWDARAITVLTAEELQALRENR